MDLEPEGGRLPGRRIGRYELGMLLGDGGLGRAWLAGDPVLARQVVVKVARPERLSGLAPAERERLFDRLRAGARVTASLAHPSIVTLHDLGDDPEFGPYAVFEWVSGPTLRERLEAGPLAPGEVAVIARAIGSALAYVHAAGSVHRNVRPENIVLSALGPILTEPSVDDALVPVAPEGTFGPFADQFCLAATLLEALTGKATRGAPSTALPVLRSFPHLDTIFDRALARDPKKRFSSSDVLGIVVATELEGTGTSPLPPASVSSMIPRSTRRWQNIAAGVAVLVIFALVVLGRRRPRDEDGPGTDPSSTAASTASTASTPATPATPHPHPPRVHPSSSSAAAGAAGAAGAAATANALDASAGSSLPPLPAPIASAAPLPGVERERE